MPKTLTIIAKSGMFWFLGEFSRDEHQAILAGLINDFITIVIAVVMLCDKKGQILCCARGKESRKCEVVGVVLYGLSH